MSVIKGEIIKIHQPKNDYPILIIRSDGDFFTVPISYELYDKIFGSKLQLNTSVKLDYGNRQISFVSSDYGG